MISKLTKISTVLGLLSVSGMLWSQTVPFINLNVGSGQPPVNYVNAPLRIDHSSARAGATAGAGFGAFNNVMNFGGFTYNTMLYSDPFSPEAILSTQLRRPFRSRWVDPTDRQNQYCGVPTQSDINNIAAAVGTNCWNPSDEAETGVSVDVTDAYTKDLQVCHCLNTSTESKIAEMMRKPASLLPNFKPSKSVLDNYTRNARQIEQEIARERDGLAFHASLLSSDKKFTSFYIMNPDSTNAQGTMALQNQIINNAQDTIAKFAGAGFLRKGDPKIKADLISGVSRTIASFKVPERDNKYFEEKPFAANQCVGGREYLGFKQLPSEELLAAEFESEEFKAEDWNYDVLMGKHANMMKNVDANPALIPEVNKLRAKIKFLNKNPLVKTFFKSKAWINQEDNKFLSPEKKGWIETVVKKNVNNYSIKKNELFNILRDGIVKKADCRPYSAKCLRESVKQGKASDLQKSLKDFFSNESVGEMLDVENERESFAKIQSLGSESMFSPAGFDMTRNAVIAKFSEETGLKSPADCIGQNVEVQSCFETFVAYCQTLKNDVIPGAAKVAPSQMMLGSIESELAFDLEPDFAKNQQLRDFNKVICETPRAARRPSDGTNVKTFMDYRTEYCSKSPSPAECANQTDPESVSKIRAKYLNDYPYSANPNPEIPDDEVLAFQELINKKPFKDIDTRSGGGLAGNETTYKADGTSSRSDDMVAYQRDNGIKDNTNDVAPTTKVATKESNLSTASKTLESVSRQMAQDDSSNDNTMNMNYSNTMANSAVNNAATETKIENMTDPQRQELMDDWQQEYDTWKKKYGSNSSQDGNGSSAPSAEEAAMKAKIEALEQLLAQQKKLTDDQYKLLNDAIASQNRTVQNQVVANSTVDESQTGPRQRNSSNNFVVDNEGSDTNRAPASVQESQFNTSGANAGAGASTGGGAASSLGRTSGSSAISDSSADSIAREEAKLVNLRRFSDGSITIESSGNAGSASANAIAVPVSDEQYRILQTNPTGLNLQQLQQSIPADQLAKLEKSGEIVILLRNGSNPPFEVKVEKKDNKLVYRLKDNNGKPVNPVKRVFTRQALELQLKVSK